MDDFDNGELLEGIKNLREATAAFHHAALRSRDLGRIQAQSLRQRIAALSKQNKDSVPGRQGEHE